MTELPNHPETVRETLRAAKAFRKGHTLRERIAITNANSKTRLQEYPIRLLSRTTTKLSRHPVGTEHLITRNIRSAQRTLATYTEFG